MNALEVTPYLPSDRSIWNDHVSRSKNATFLLHRDYLEYHAERFVDASVLIRNGHRVVAAFPASRHGAEVRSHGGLTYGGVVTTEQMSLPEMLEVFDVLLLFYRAQGINSLLYKPIPHIYHAQPSEEDLYALFRHDAKLVRRDPATTMSAARRAPRTKGRNWAVKQGAANGLVIAESDDWTGFMEVERQLLESKHGVAPVHTAAELSSLNKRFPNNIRLFTATRDSQLLGGSVIYETDFVAHAQYICSTELGRGLRALDVLFDWLLREVYATKPWFDFGISTVDDGRQLNTGLVANKESWGARTIVYDQYRLSL